MAQLYTFTISHYGEKARWALDYLGVQYQLNTISPLQHKAIGLSLGLHDAQVPFLQSDAQVIAGSNQILKWAQQHSSKSLFVEEHEVWQTVTRLDTVLGIHTRRLFYSEAIVEYPELLLSVFTHNLSAKIAEAVTQQWPNMRAAMIAQMDLGATQWQESLERVEAELDWLDELTTQHEPYLVGNLFSAADLSAAALLGFIALPEQHACYSLFQLPPRLAEKVTHWSSRPCWQWVNKLYAAFR